MTGTTAGYILKKDDEQVGQSVLCSALNDYCGKEYKFVFGEKKRAMLENDYIKNMDCWPGENSVTAAGGVVIVKLGEEGE